MIEFVIIEYKFNKNMANAVIEKSIKITKLTKPVGNFSTIMVSLFLVLLSFFIFLTSISQQNKVKSEKVLQNLRYEFKGKSLQTKIKYWDNDNLAGASRIFGFKESIETVLKTKRLQDTKIIQRGNIISFELRFAQIFSEEKTQIKSSGFGIIKDIFTSLDKNYLLIKRVEISMPLFSDRKALIRYLSYISDIAKYYSPEIQYTYSAIPMKNTEKDRSIRVKVLLKN